MILPYQLQLIQMDCRVIAQVKGVKKGKHEVYVISGQKYTYIKCTDERHKKRPKVYIKLKA